MKNTSGIVLLLAILSSPAMGQDYRWQQRVEYTMNVRLDVSSHKMTGTQKLVYLNNSPDTLARVYYHLYFNAFQPGSMMDVRSRSISDPDPRIGDRISKLTESEIGYHHVQSLKHDGKDVNYRIEGTVMEVTLTRPLLPKTKAVFEMTFDSQVPLQIRRSGRDSKGGIAFTMTQWYPKIAEYDFQGWHAYPYVFREFHSVWGDFDVTITLDPTYIIAATGKLQNADKVGHGYEKPDAKVNRPQGDLTWRFLAKDVIDFAWAADPDYTHDITRVPNGPELHFFYQKNDDGENWKKVQPIAVKAFEYLNVHFGKYPFDTYSVIQGGDGGMEYPMCTMIVGGRTLSGLIGVTIHEVAHSWFQMALASNESLYSWLDEGFADFAADETGAALSNQQNPHAGSYNQYFGLVSSGLQEPASQHSDHFSTNRAYSTAAYSMGAVFLNQLKYLIGEENFYKGMLRYYNTWKMKHPEPNDFIRVMEKVSGLQLHWYLRYWIGTTKRIDYGINSVISKDGDTFVTLERIGEFPMPIDLTVIRKDGTIELIYIPMNEIMGKKPVENKSIKRTDSLAWPWVNNVYTVKIAGTDVTSLEIDPSLRMADINRKNNRWNLEEKTKEFKETSRD